MCDEAHLNMLLTYLKTSQRLRGGIVFVDVIPKSASGKILRRVLKERSKEDKPLGIMKKAKL
jgi:acyl-coenzyme A synthetase/AMP-(fatty) acid ligase